MGKGTRKVDRNNLASRVVELLAQKHRADVFVAECKDGPSQHSKHLRMDAWVMPRSWSKPTVTAYEVKVDRGDFTGDRKWQHYLDYCNEFYFVCPTGLIDPKELPAEAGLLYVSKTWTRLFKKKAAPRRDVAIPESVFRYVLMCRARIGEERYDTYAGSKLDYWREQLAQIREQKELGREVSRAIRGHVAEVEHQNRLLQKQIEGYEAFRATCREAGLDPDTLCTRVGHRQAVDRLRGEIPEGLVNAVNQAIDDLERLRSAIADIEAAKKAPRKGVA